MLRIKNLFRRQPPSRTGPDDQLFEQYCHDVPSAQNAIDALPGWNSGFPPFAKVVAGTHPLFADARIDWAIHQAGSIKDKKVLEIGPLEGMHTYMLNKHGPALIDAIEANKQCFLRCLVAKEILGIERARFHLGDALKWLEFKEERYDIGIASGVLYHMADPATFLHRLASRCDNLFIWTHYFSDTAMPVQDERRLAFTGKVEERMIGNLPVRYYERRYFHANETETFCGGMKDRHYWMHREDILSVLSALGFANLAIAHEMPDHPGGPCFSVFAKRAVSDQRPEGAF